MYRLRHFRLQGPPDARHRRDLPRNRVLVGRRLSPVGAEVDSESGRPLIARSGRYAVMASGGPMTVYKTAISGRRSGVVGQFLDELSRRDDRDSDVLELEQIAVAGHERIDEGRSGARRDSRRQGLGRPPDGAASGPQPAS